MTYADAVQFLYDLQLFGAKFGLENTFKLAALAGNPQEKLRFIHVAGTNGKGSTCAMLESIYRAAGLRVGLFTSPHLVSFAERIQINRQLISENDVARLVNELQEEVVKVERVSPLRAASEISNHGAHGVTRPTSDVSFQPTFFEFVTVMALKYFAEQNCDLVIWETGMGGRLDATNIVTPLASVITNVDFDHQKWLGNTLAEIAREKAGIIKPEIPVVTSASEPDALEIIIKTAQEKSSPLTKVDWNDTNKPPLNEIVVGLPGEHQRLNAVLAIATVRALGRTGDSSVPSGHWPDEMRATPIMETAAMKNAGVDSIPSGGSPLGTGQWPVLPRISENAIRDGLSQVQWPGRFQQIKTKSGQTILLDGAHNPSGAMALRDAIAKYYPGKKPTLILGILQDKEWSAICGILASIAKKIFVVPVSSERTAAPKDMEPAIREANPSTKVVALNSLPQALEATAQDSFVVITGSLYLIGEALEMLQKVSQKSNERGLNEWKPSV